MLRTNLARGVVEIDEIAGAHVHRADAKAHLSGIDAVEVHELFQCGLEELGLIKARCCEAAVRVQPWPRLAQGKEPRHATNQHPGSTQLIESASGDISRRRK